MSKPYLNKLQLHHFYTQGYLKLDNVLPSILMHKLDILFDELMDINHGETDKVININNGNHYVTNIENICNKGNLACLELLGHPSILKIAKQICGNDFFMIQEFSVIKIKGDNLPVLWHQDMFNERKGNCFTMGIYLDDANQGDGALKIIPKSHLSNAGICDIVKQPATEIAMQAGGILLHDMMLAHSSLPIKINDKRRVIYFEFLTATQVLSEKIYTEELIQRRTKLLFLATYFYKKNNPNQSEFTHNNKYAIDVNEINFYNILTEIYSKQIHARPSNYCFEINNTQQNINPT